MALKYSSDLSDTNARVYIVGTKNVTTTEVEASVGVTAHPDRQFVRIYNDGPETIYFGPSGITSSTGEPIRKKQWVEIAARDSLEVYIITDSATAIAASKPVSVCP